MEAKKRKDDIEGVGVSYSSHPIGCEVCSHCVDYGKGTRSCEVGNCSISEGGIPSWNYFWCQGHQFAESCDYYVDIRETWPMAVSRHGFLTSFQRFYQEV